MVGGQINEPFWIGGESAHHFQGGDGVLLSNRDGSVEVRVDDPLADHIFDIEQIIQLLLGRQCRRAIRIGKERLH